MAVEGSINGESINGTITISGTLNGTLTVGSGSTPAEPVLQEKTVRGKKLVLNEITPDAGYDGLSKVNIRPIVQQLENVTLTPDIGAVQYVSSNYVGYNIVTVNSDPRVDAMRFGTELPAEAFKEVFGAYVMLFKFIQSLGDESLSNVTLKELHLGYDGVVTLGNNVFGDRTGWGAVKVHVPSAQLANYQADASWAALVSAGTVTLDSDYIQ